MSRTKISFTKKDAVIANMFSNIMKNSNCELKI